MRLSSSTKEETSLFKQSYFLPFHTHNPLSRSPIAVCVLKKFLPCIVHWLLFFPTLLLLPQARFTLIFPVFAHLHCLTPPHLFNLLLKQVLTALWALYIKYSALFHCESPRNYWISASCILTHFVSLKHLPSWSSADTLEASLSISVLTSGAYECTQKSV